MDTQFKEQVEWHYGTQISFRVTPEIKEKLSNAYHAIAGTDSKIPLNVFMGKVVDYAVNSLIIREELQSSILRVQELETKIEDLQLVSESSSELSNKLKEVQEKNEQLLNENMELSREIEDKNLNLKTLISENEAFKKDLNENTIPEDTVLVSFTNLENAIISRICEKETKRVGKEITPEIILKNTLVDYLINGPRDFFPRLSMSEMKNIKSSL